jgi:hypothetical protein
MGNKTPSITSAEIDTGVGTISPKHDEAEVFGGGGEDAVNFRTVGWLAAAVFMIKMTFATGVLSIPAALYTLGAIAGSIFIVFWGALNTYMAYIQVSIVTSILGGILMTSRDNLNSRTPRYTPYLTLHILLLSPLEVHFVWPTSPENSQTYSISSPGFFAPGSPR